MVFWKPKLSVFAENNREKLLEYGYDFFPNDFDVFSLIDNTTNSTCQPGLRSDIQTGIAFCSITSDGSVSLAK